MILEMVGGWYLGMLIGFTTSTVLWYAARSRARHYVKCRRSLPQGLTKHIHVPPPDLTAMRFPLIHSQFVPYPTPDALYRPASDENMPAGLHRHPNSTSYYECVPGRDGDQPSIIMVDQHCSIGTIDEHVAEFERILERQLRRLLVTPGTQSVEMPRPELLLCDQEDSPPVWLDSVQQITLAQYWRELTALQEESAYRSHHLVDPAEVSRHRMTRQYDQMLAQRAAPYSQEPRRYDPEGTPGEPGDLLASPGGPPVTIADLQQAIDDWAARKDEEREAAGLRYLSLPDCPQAAGG